MQIIHTIGVIPGRPGIGPIAILARDTHMSPWVTEPLRLRDPCGVDVLAFPYIPEGAVVVDAGAMLGDHAALYAHKASVVHTFEPQPDCFECLKQNCAHLQNVHPYQLALSDRNGEAHIQQEANVGASWITQAIGPAAIKTVTLDELGLAPGFIKLDVEGSEVRALRGARETIKRCRPIMVMEVNRHALGLAGFSIGDLQVELLTLGYQKCWDIRTGEPFSPLDGKAEYDIVCLP